MTESTSTRKRRTRLGRWLRLLALVPGVALLLLLVLYLTFRLFVASGLAGRVLAGQFSKTAGADVTLGKLNYDFPLRFILTDVAARSADESEPFLAVDAIKVEASLRSLFGGRVREIHVTSPRVKLRRDAEGNWSYMPPAGDTTASARAPLVLPFDLIRVESGILELALGDRQVVAHLPLLAVEREDGVLHVEAKANLSNSLSRMDMDAIIDPHSAIIVRSGSADIKSFPVIVLDPALRILGYRDLSLVDGTLDFDMSMESKGDDRLLSMKGEIRRLSCRYQGRGLGPFRVGLDAKTRYLSRDSLTSIELLRLEVAPLGILNVSGAFPLSVAVPKNLSLRFSSADLAEAAAALGIPGVESGALSFFLSQARNPRGGGPLRARMELSAFSLDRPEQAIRGARFEARMEGEILDNGDGASADIALEGEAASLRVADALYDLAGLPLTAEGQLDYDRASDALTLADGRFDVGRDLDFTAAGVVAGLLSEIRDFDFQMALKPAELKPVLDQAAHLHPAIRPVAEPLHNGSIRAEVALTGDSLDPAIDGSLRLDGVELDAHGVAVAGASLAIPFHLDGALHGRASLAAGMSEVTLRSATDGEPIRLTGVTMNASMRSGPDGLLFPDLKLRAETLGAAGEHQQLTGIEMAGEILVDASPMRLEFNELHVEAGELGRFEAEGDLTPGAIRQLTLSTEAVDLERLALASGLVSREQLPEGALAGTASLRLNARDLTGNSGQVEVRLSLNDAVYDTGSVFAQVVGEVHLTGVQSADGTELNAEILVEPGAAYLFEDSSWFLDDGNLDIRLWAQLRPESHWPAELSLDVKAPDRFHVNGEASFGEPGAEGLPRQMELRLEASRLTGGATPTRTLAEAVQHFVPAMEGKLLCFDKAAVHLATRELGKVLQGRFAVDGLSLESPADGLALQGARVNLPVHLDFRQAPLAADNIPGATGPCYFEAIRIGNIELKNVSFDMLIERNRFIVPKPIVIPLFGGELRVANLDLRTGAGESGLQCAMDIRGLDIADITRDSPFGPFTGTVDGRFDQITFGEAHAVFDGSVTARIFDGAVTVDRIRIDRYRDPFLREVAFRLHAGGLNLLHPSTLTGFGLVTGILEIDVPEAALCVSCGWLPTDMVASVQTVKVRGVRQSMDIRAVRNLTIMAGGILPTGLFLDFFSHYSYDGFGFAVNIGDDTVQVRGRYPYDDFDRILKGAGLPRINIDLPTRERIRGYRRMMESMKERLSNLTLGNVQVN